MRGRSGWGRFGCARRRRQVEALLGWAAGWPTRSWAIEGARGLGQLLAQQLIAAGERVAGRAAEAGRPGAAAGHRADQQERPERRPLGRGRRAARPRSARARRRGPHHGDAGLGAPLSRPGPAAHPGAVPAARRAVRAGSRRSSQGAADQPGDRGPRRHRRRFPCRAGETRAGPRPGRRPAAHRCAAPRGQTPHRAARWPHPEPRSPTSTVSGRSWPAPCSATSATSAASPPGTTSPPTTAPHRSRSPPATGRSTGCPAAGTGNSTTPSTWPRSPRSATAAARAAPTTSSKIAEGMTGKCALRALKRKISDTLYERMIDDARRAPRSGKDPGGQSGNDAAPARPAHTPKRPALRTSHSRASTNSRTATDKRHAHIPACS